MTLRAVKLRPCLVHKLPWRDWGRPHHLFVGKVWTNGMRIYCVTKQTKAYNVVERRNVIIVDDADQEWFPATWSKAVLRYAKRWPGSARWASPFLRLSSQQRGDLLRVLARRLVKADDIGAPCLAMTIGSFAGVGPNLGED